MSFDAARDVQVLLDDLEALLDAGAADQVRQPLERAVTRLRKVMLDADDSAGVLGDACQRAAELHARACVESAPDGVKLARWLMKFRVESPGWPDVTLGMYASALGQRGLGMYRTELARQDALHAEADRFSRFEIDRMLLELADHDGDVDDAVRLLSRDAEHTAYGAIITRLQCSRRARPGRSRVGRSRGGRWEAVAPWRQPIERLLARARAGLRHLPERRPGRRCDRRAARPLSPPTRPGQPTVTHRRG